MNKNTEAVERLFRLVVKLAEAGRDGLSAERLIRVAGFDPAAKDPGSQLTREFRHLRAAGWQIDNVAEDGGDGHYVLLNMDHRLRLRLSPQQQAALRRAALLADRQDLADRLDRPAAPDQAGAPVPLSIRTRAAEELETVLSALTGHRLLEFRYKNRARTAHPARVEVSHGNWYLHAQETEGGTVKRFRVDRMSEVRAQAPGTARVLTAPRHSLQPLSWEKDPPVTVEVRTQQEFLPEMTRWLGEPAGVGAPDVRGRVVLRYVVTHREGLRSRIYELGTRVEVLGPPEIRADLIAHLELMGGHA